MGLVLHELFWGGHSICRCHDKKGHLTLDGGKLEEGFGWVYARRQQVFK